MKVCISEIKQIKCLKLSNYNYSCIGIGNTTTFKTKIE